MILNLLNHKEPVYFRVTDFVAMQGSRQIYGHISLFLGQEMIVHRWNLQWELEWSGPTQALSKGPFHCLYSDIKRAPWALLAGRFFFFLDCFHFFTEDCPRLLATWDWGEPWFGRRKGEVHGGLLNWIALPPWPFPWTIGFCALKYREVPVSQA